MTAFGFKKEIAIPEWMIFRAEVKSICGAKKWAVRNGFARVFVPAQNAGGIWDDSVGFIKIDGKYVKQERYPYDAIPLCFTVFSPYGNRDSRKRTLSVLQECARV